VNLPNALTLLRIFFVPLLVAALVQEHRSLQVGNTEVPNELLALAIFLTAAGTDLLDGYLARKWGQITTVGTLLDPIADKLLVSAALISLVQVHVLPGWMAILIIGREFAMSGLRSIAAAERYVIKANDLGKLKLVSQVVAISLLLVSIKWPELRETAIGSMWVVMAFTVVSAIVYFNKFWWEIDERVKRRRRRELIVIEQLQRRAAKIKG
jgi:CDP-diacylglycerol--glycerol-3-phosphate 3-phosphatidyltransferase